MSDLIARLRAGTVIEEGVNDLGTKWQTVRNSPPVQIEAANRIAKLELALMEIAIISHDISVAQYAASTLGWTMNELDRKRASVVR